jgi:alpha-galactosidase
MRKLALLSAAICVDLFLALSSAPLVQAEIRQDPTRKLFILRSGSVEYRLAQSNGTVYLDYFGPTNAKIWELSPAQQGPPQHLTARYETGGRLSAAGLFPDDLEFVHSEISHPRESVDELKLTFRHRNLPLEFSVVYDTMGATGVITRQTTILNVGSAPAGIDSLPSLSWSLPPGEYELTYLWGNWSRERQETTEVLGPGTREFLSAVGRSSGRFSPWFCLRNQKLGVRYLAQLAYSGNWQMSFERTPSGGALEAEDLAVSLGMRFDANGPLVLPPGGTFTIPLVAFTASAGDLDETANQLHRFQRDFVFARTPANQPPLVQFNSWYPFPGPGTVADMKRCADVAAALGVDVFVLDGSWFSDDEKNPLANVGDWDPKASFLPNGLGELSNYVHGKGLKFGLWVEMEAAGLRSRVAQEHPDWLFAVDGKPYYMGRYHLNFAKPEVRAWARAHLDRLIRDNRLDWVKFDYNVEFGERLDQPATGRQGTVLYDHLYGYYQWLDGLRAAYPNLVIENCASGGMRFDLGMTAHTHTTWLSDVVDPKASVQLGYGCTVEFAPEVCNHWMVGDTESGAVDLSKPAGWWDFMLRVPMNGQYGISSQVFDWSPELTQRAKENIALYKRLRETIAGADVYHLTPPPDHDRPTGWTALQYVARARDRSVVMAYRLENGDPEITLKLHGLEPARRYTILENGLPSGLLTGAQLAKDGLPVKSAEEWRATAFELRADR